jgi:hypothetical protein
LKENEELMDPYKFSDEVTHGWHARRPKTPKRMGRLARASLSLALIATTVGSVMLHPTIANAMSFLR